MKENDPAEFLPSDLFSMRPCSDPTVIKGNVDSSKMSIKLYLNNIFYFLSTFMYSDRII